MPQSVAEAGSLDREVSEKDQRIGQLSARLAGPSTNDNIESEKHASPLPSRLNYAIKHH